MRLTCLYACFPIAVSQFGFWASTNCFAEGNKPTIYFSKLPMSEKHWGMKDEEKDFDFFCAADSSYFGKVNTKDNTKVGDISAIPPVSECNGRLIGTSGDQVRLAYVERVIGKCPDTTVNGTFKEGKHADPVIEQQIKVVLEHLPFDKLFGFAELKAITKEGKPAPKAEDKTVRLCVTEQVFSKLEDDSTEDSKLTVSVKRPTDKQASADKAINLVISDVQNTFFSLDFPYPSIKSVKYDTTLHSLVSNNASYTPYLGYNYQIGDIMANYDWFTINRVILKADIQHTKSYATGIGYRVSAWSNPSQFLSAGVGEIFIMDLMRRGDSFDGTTVSSRFHHVVRFGLGFGVKF